MVKKVPVLLFDALPVILLLIIDISLVVHLDQYLDISFSDEDNYMLWGLRFPDFYIQPENGPLYSLWYYFLHLFVSDRIQLYYTNWQILTVLPSVIFYLLLRRLNINYGISLALAIFFCYAEINFVSWPRISNFSICLVGIGLFVASLLKNPLYKIYILTVTSLLVSYVRPELFMCFIIFLGILLIIFLKAISSTKKNNLILFLSLIILLVLLKVCYDWPMFSRQGSRSIVAFGQHYTLNKFKSEDPNADVPWGDWEKYFRVSFGNANSMVEIIKNNPKEFLWMINTNFTGFYNDLYLKVLPQFLSPYKVLKIHIVPGVLLIIVILLQIVLYQFSKTSSNIEPRSILEYKYEMLGAIIFVIPPILSCIILFPRGHYLYLIMLPLLFVLVNGLTWVNVKFSTLVQLAIVFIGFFVLFFTKPEIQEYYPQSFSGNKKIVRGIQGLNIKDPVFILENQGGIDCFLPSNFNSRFIWSKEGNFYSFLNSSGINMVWVTPDLKNNWRFQHDQEWLEFEKNYTNYDFDKFEFEGGYGYVLIKRNLLKL